MSIPSVLEQSEAGLIGPALSLKSSPLAPAARCYIPKEEIDVAWFSREEPYADSRARKSAAQKAGLSYQKRIGAFLSAQVDPDNLMSGAWIAYCESGGRRRYCQPDFLVSSLDGEAVTIVEAKIRWTPDAWWQLRRLYEPVLRRVGRWKRISVCCATRSYDPHIPGGEAPHFIDELSEVKQEAFNVWLVR